MLHEAYFEALGGNGKIGGSIGKAIGAAFGSVDQFETHFRATAMDRWSARLRASDADLTRGDIPAW